MRTAACCLFLATTVVLPDARAQERTGLRFEDRAVSSALTFRHETGAGTERYMVETMGSGLAAVDLDVDGWLDVYFAQ